MTIYAEILLVFVYNSKTPKLNAIFCTEILADGGTKLIALRCAGYNQVDVKSAKEVGIAVARVPAYSPYAVAEHTVAMIMTLNRRIHRAYNRVREGNFSLNGLAGFDMNGKVVGVVGTGKIGTITASILKGFGCTVQCSDIVQNPEVLTLGLEYVGIEHLFRTSDIICLLCPLNFQTYHLINKNSISIMKDGVFLVNTSRGALMDAGTF